MADNINDQIFALENMDVTGFSKRAYRLHLDLINELKDEHVFLVAA